MLTPPFPVPTHQHPGVDHSARPSVAAGGHGIGREVGDGPGAGGARAGQTVSFQAAQWRPAIPADDGTPDPKAKARPQVASGIDGRRGRS
jgi:hypothetical protein